MRDVGLLRNAIHEVTIILQASFAKIPKFTREILRYMHLLDINTVKPELRNVYIINLLINIQGLPFTIYEIDLFLEHQNGKFKQF